MATSKYDAFISYSHAADSNLGEALEAAMQRFGKPLFKLRGMRVFRDTSDLSLAPDLWGNIEAALSASDHFLLLASPHSAASPWVAKELEYWIATKGADTVLIVQTDGHIQWDKAANDYNWEETKSLPLLLKGVFVGEPLYLDMRWVRTEPDLSLENKRFTMAVARIVAAIQRRPVKDVYGEELQRHKKMIWLRNGAIALLTLLTTASLIAAGVALEQSRIATAERERAEGLNLDLQAQIKLVSEERDRANRAADAEQKARMATQEQLDFTTEILNDQLKMRDPLDQPEDRLLVLRLFFGYDQTNLVEEGRQLLSRLGALARANPGLQLLVVGHFAEYSPDGEPVTERAALAPAERRGRAVMEYLQSLGVPANQIRFVSYGKERPLLRSTNPEEKLNVLIRQINSRADVYAVLPAAGQSRDRKRSRSRTPLMNRRAGIFRRSGFPVSRTPPTPGVERPGGQSDADTL